MAENKQALIIKDKKELHKRASKEMLNWCSPSYIALQFAQIEKSEQRNFIRKADVKNFLTRYQYGG
jgi:nucleoside 2-deoxyribosyltransferase